MRRVLLVTTLLALTITACASASATEQPSIMIRRPTATPTPEDPIPTPEPQPTRPAATSTPEDPTLEPRSTGPAEDAVIKQLAANLGLQEDDISVLRSEEVEFGDACLGVSMPDVMCAEVVTPGRIIVLEAKDVQYEYHTSEDGSRLQPATLALIWKRAGGIAGFCDTLTVFRSGEVYTSKCRQTEGRMGTFADLLSAEEQAQFSDWIAEFAETDLDASDPKGVSDRMEVTLKLFGSGRQPPTKSEQRMLFEFAQNLYQKLAK